MTRILCFGDSTTEGRRDREGGWPQRLHNHLYNIYIDETGSPRHTVYNLGVGGQRSADLLDRIEAETDARSSRGDVITIIMIGVKDTEMEDGKRIVDGEKYVENIRQIIEISKKKSRAVLVAAILPINEEVLRPAPWGLTYSAKEVAAYNAALEKVCMELDVEFVRMDDVFRSIDLDKVLTDGIHPNGIGNQLIADKFRNRVEELANNYEATT